MKETKVYVEELPKSCVGCKHFAENRRQCNLKLCLQWSEKKFKFNDCPLIDIKTHDRELVEKVCEKIKKKARWLWYFVYAEQKDYFKGNRYVLSEKDLNEIFDQIQKEYEK